MAAPRAARTAPWTWRGAGAGMLAGALIGALEALVSLSPIAVAVAAGVVLGAIAGGTRSWEMLLGDLHERRSPAARARFRGRGDRPL